MNISEKDEARFWSKVNIPHGGFGCWEWTGHRNPKGYGQMGFSKLKISAHRVAWEVCIGKIPEGLCVLHRCDNRACCNPSHLFVGTISDNIIDMIKKGRHPNLKLTVENVVVIKGLLRKGVIHKEIAASYGVCKSSVSMISAGLNWAHVNQRGE